MNNIEMIQADMSGSAPESFRDRVATVDKDGHRKWVYAKKPAGKLYRARTWVSLLFFLLFVACPFIYVDGRPLLQFNIPEAKFVIFTKVFWPQDFFIFGLAMITFVVFIVLFTAAFGRLFCGWVCPQTIFMEMLFRKIEYLLEGDAASQRLLAAQPWTSRKIFIKLTKHVIFFSMAFLIANLFLSYIISVKSLQAIISGPIQEHYIGLISICIFSAVFYAVYAFFREQACTVVCPYGRLQSVLLDKNSMVVAYHYKRGEPRAKFKKQRSGGEGDCIDCGQCVQVCPTGIDIRNGTQMECIGCTACIDACNQMMRKINRPTGLIAYASEEGIQKGKRLHFTGRMALYTVLLGILLSLLVLMLWSRKEVDITLMRTPGLLYQERGRDSIANLYNIKVANKTNRTVPLSFRLAGIQGKIDVVGTKPVIQVDAGGQGAGSLFIILPKSAIGHRETKLRVEIYEGPKEIDVIATNFLSPVSAGINE